MVWEDQDLVMRSYIDNYIEQHNNNTFERYLSELRLEKVSNILNIRNPKRILDIGIGLYPVYINYRKYVIYSGIERSKELCNKAFKKSIDAGFKNEYCITSITCGDCENDDDLKLACRHSETYDDIILNSILHFIKDPKEFLIKLKKYMSKSCIIYINVPNSKSFHRMLGLYTKDIKDIYELSDMDIKFGQINRFCLNTLETLVTDCGFSAINKGTFCIKPFPEHQMNKIIDRKLFDGLDMLIGVFPSFGCELFMEIV